MKKPRSPNPPEHTSTDEMRLVVGTGQYSKPKGLLILGDSGSGKSAILEHFRKSLDN